MQKILLAQAYQDRKEEVENIIHGFEQGGTLIHKGRNCIKSFDTSTGSWNVKRYHKPSLLNRLVYSFIRKPKGLRAFEYPRRILAAGFETPKPVAYVEQRECGLLGYSFFISEQCPYSRRFYEFGDSKVEDCKDIIEAFVHFTASFHEAGICHRDYSPGNILFDQINGKWHFSIVDINRTYFGPVSVEQGCKNFARLWGQPEFFRFIGKLYAQERKANEEDCVRWVTQARNTFWKPRAKNFHLPYQLNF